MKKRIYIEHGDLIINVNKQCFFTFFTEWNQLNFYKKFNWYTVTLIHIFFEKDSVCEGYLFQATLLGFSFSFRYNTKEALKLFKLWEKEHKQLLKKSKKVASKKSKSK